MAGFRDLKVWAESKKLAVEIYRITKKAQFSKDFGLKDQVRRAAEGDERGSNKEAIRFFYISKGSLAELQTQLEIAHEIGYLNQSSLKDLNDKCTTIGKMLGSLIKARSNKI